MTQPKVLVIVGPTASGKSALAVKLAKELNGEVISADSRQVYKGLDIGTGKITNKEMQGIPHHLLDVASPRRRFTLAQYQKLAEKKLIEIIARGKLPIVCGGTGFYIKALVDNIALPAVKPNLTLRKELLKLSTAELAAKLQQLDPERAKNIDTHNPRRLMRAIEIAAALGQVPPATSRPAKYEFIQYGITLEPEKLRQNIHERLLARMKQGLVKEVENLRTGGLSWQRLDDLGLEYRFVAKYLQNKLSKEEMLEQLETAINQYAKRQMTWFKKDKRITWLNSKDVPVF
jgi:tRNA dimethylallyltransferase